MTDEEIQKLAKALVGQVVEMLSRKPEPPTPAATPGRPRWMKVKDYAAHAGCSRTTVQTWIKAGLPAAKTTRGHRVDVPAADEWIKMGGIQRLGHLDA